MFQVRFFVDLKEVGEFTLHVFNLFSYLERRMERFFKEMAKYGDN